MSLEKGGGKPPGNLDTRYVPWLVHETNGLGQPPPSGFGTKLTHASRDNRTRYEHSPDSFREWNNLRVARFPIHAGLGRRDVVSNVIIK